MSVVIRGVSLLVVYIDVFDFNLWKLFHAVLVPKCLRKSVFTIAHEGSGHFLF